MLNNIVRISFMKLSGNVINEIEIIEPNPTVINKAIINDSIPYPYAFKLLWNSNEGHVMDLVKFLSDHRNDDEIKQLAVTVIYPIESFEEAVFNGHYETVRNMIAEGSEVKGEFLKTAVSNGHYETVKILIDEIDKSPMEDYQHRRLYYNILRIAVENGSKYLPDSDIYKNYINITKLLFERGINGERFRLCEFTLNEFKYLLKAEIALDDYMEDFIYSKELLQAAVEAGGDINKLDKNGYLILY